LNKLLIDSAINFALQNESKTDYDLRIACLKAYGNEPGFRILGPTRERGKPSGLIIKNGYIVAQWGDIKRADMTFSVTKSFLSTIAGLAYDKRLIKNIDDPVNKYVWDDHFKSEHNSKITWKHFAYAKHPIGRGACSIVCDWADRPPKNRQHRRMEKPETSRTWNKFRIQ
jgi:hypothetical protein